jgi:hypothetical protein
MNPTLILAAINSLIGAVPSLLALYDTIRSGGTVTEVQVTAALAQYETDKAALLADIAANG